MKKNSSPRDRIILKDISLLIQAQKLFEAQWHLMQHHCFHAMLSCWCSARIMATHPNKKKKKYLLLSPHTHFIWGTIQSFSRISYHCKRQFLCAGLALVCPRVCTCQYSPGLPLRETKMLCLLATSPMWYLWHLLAGLHRASIEMLFIHKRFFSYRIFSNRYLSNADKLINWLYHCSPQKLMIFLLPPHH